MNLRLLGSVVIVIVLIAVYFVVRSQDKVLDITAANNVFSYYHLNNKLHKVTVPAGKYKPTELATALTAVLSAKEAGWTVSWDKITKKFTVENQAFKWDRCADAASIFATIGFSADAKCGVEWKNTETSSVALE